MKRYLKKHVFSAFVLAILFSCSSEKEDPKPDFDKADWADKVADKFQGSYQMSVLTVDSVNYDPRYLYPFYYNQQVELEYIDPTRRIFSVNIWRPRDEISAEFEILFDTQYPRFAQQVENIPVPVYRELSVSFDSDRVYDLEYQLDLENESFLLPLIISLDKIEGARGGSGSGLVLKFEKR